MTLQEQQLFTAYEQWLFRSNNSLLLSKTKKKTTKSFFFLFVIAWIHAERITKKTNDVLTTIFFSVYFFLYQFFIFIFFIFLCFWFSLECNQVPYFSELFTLFVWKMDLLFFYLCYYWMEKRLDRLPPSLIVGFLLFLFVWFLFQISKQFSVCDSISD